MPLLRAWAQSNSHVSGVRWGIAAPLTSITGVKSSAGSNLDVAGIDLANRCGIAKPRLCTRGPHEPTKNETTNREPAVLDERGGERPRPSRRSYFIMDQDSARLQRRRGHLNEALELLTDRGSRQAMERT